jgi:hypothetical protein
MSMWNLFTKLLRTHRGKYGISEVERFFSSETGRGDGDDGNIEDAIGAVKLRVRAFAPMYLQREAIVFNALSVGTAVLRWVEDRGGEESG